MDGERKKKEAVTFANATTVGARKLPGPIKADEQKIQNYLHPVHHPFQMYQPRYSVTRWRHR